MNTIYLDSKDVPQYLRGGYTGKHFKAVVTDSISIAQDAGVWNGGSRDDYRFVQLSTGKPLSIAESGYDPWDSRRAEFNAPLPIGVALVEHSIFRGIDMGLTFYVHPDSKEELLSTLAISPLI